MLRRKQKASHPATATACSPGRPGHGLLDRGQIRLELVAVDGGNHVTEDLRNGLAVVVGPDHEERPLPAVPVVGSLIARRKLLQCRGVIPAVPTFARHRGGVKRPNLIGRRVEVHSAARGTCKLNLLSCASNT